MDIESFVNQPTDMHLESITAIAKWSLNFSPALFTTPKFAKYYMRWKVQELKVESIIFFLDKFLFAVQPGPPFKRNTHSAFIQRCYTFCIVKFPRRLKASVSYLISCSVSTPQIRFRPVIATAQVVYWILLDRLPNSLKLSGNNSKECVESSARVFFIGRGKCCSHRAQICENTSEIFRTHSVNIF